ncbi:MAG: glycoside hydrolase family 32 protein [Terracidiphilus sp.]
MRIRLFAASCLLALLAFACSPRPGRAQAQSNSSLYRPAFHFSPQRNWINDPAGLVFDGGEYHLFYQYNPQGDLWGHMSWGHSVSRDLLNWQELPVALAEENGVGVFTGSAVLDAANTSGFGANGIAPLVAIFTANSPGLQTENLAYSLDRGRTWTRYAANPILDLHESDFRDPMVFWHAPTKRWVMAVSLALKHKILFYASTDLKTWTKLSEFGPAGANAVSNWECPNFFPLTVANLPGKIKWVLEMGVGDNGPAGGSSSQYFVGDFDGATFVNDNPDSKTLWADYGSDLYAAQSWSNLPASDGRRIAIAWMDSWRYADKLPTSPWRGQMSFPREFGLTQTSEGIRLTQAPVREIESLRGEHLQLRNATWEDAEALLKRRDWPEAVEIVATLKANDAGDFGFELRKGASYATRVGYDPRLGRVYVDRTRSGELLVSPQFAARHEAPLTLHDGVLQLQILLDRSSVELFAGNGLAAITDLIYPRPADRAMGVYAEGKPPSVVSLDVWTLKAKPAAVSQSLGKQ